MSDEVNAGRSGSTRATWWILLALIGGLLLGVVATGLGDGLREPAVRVASTVGGIWLDALKMTVVPLIIALLVTGIGGGADAARAGGIAGRSFLWFVGVLTLSAIIGALAMTTLLRLFPLPDSAAEALRAGLAGIDRSGTAASVPKLEDFLGGLLPTNPFAAAAGDQILPLVLFTALFAFALTRIEADGRTTVTRFFKAIEQAMLVMIGWVLSLAPIGVFGLAFAVGAGAGGAAFSALAHYIVLVASVGVIVMAVGYLIAIFGAGWGPVQFFRAMIAPQAVAISTQSSLASLPAMVAAARRLGVSERNIDVGLPLAVALFRATGPAMNIAVAIYVAYWTQTPLPPYALAAGVAVASVASYWAVSLPGALSFVTSIAPIALVMGVPIEPLAILIAVEVLPDIVRTLGNVVHDVAVTGAVAKRTRS
ncbi:dicarboxylate/amino acid:cation symporter [Sphingomonas jaspsi]|uniref:dicarboxylate/amino acid:cation symporter n=1 Tax=Sphingomonas jaspsi TaxID=392409 RepID=UPI0004B750F5|nr:cation:dicarboxylase symporter family transporter [Sphingomonas jaspsi]